MFRLINFILCVAVLSALCFGAFWLSTTPQPAKMKDQLQFALDTVIFKVERWKQGSDESISTMREFARTGNSAAELYQAKLLFKEANTNPEAYKEALTLVNNLAVKGIPEGQNAYGVMLRDGLGGITPNRVEAYKWFSLSATRGYKLAEENMLNLSHLLTADQINDAEARANAWLLEYLNSK